MTTPNYPVLYQINTRVWLTELSRRMGRPATLDDIPDAELDLFADMGFDWIWLLSVWQTGEEGRRISRSRPEWRHEFEETLPDLAEEDIAGSGFAITGYTVHEALCGDEGLARLRERLKARNLKLMLDFVPNHMGLDHPWVNDHPEHFVRGYEKDLAEAPQNFTWVKRPKGDLLLAHGRDPYFAGWPDTLQLNYGNPDTQDAMIGELLKIAGQCDGVRCDMAMLILPEVFERTWGIPSDPFWPKAISQVRERFPGFCFMAEVYWDLEWTLQQQGFDYAYDKRLYDRLRTHLAGPVRGHFCAGLDYQSKLARFLENHDEPRAAQTFSLDVHKAAAVITFLSPGLRFFHQGQFEGRTKRVSPHLVRGPKEPVQSDLYNFYMRLMALLREPIFRDGHWQRLECVPAWDGNWTWDSFIAFAWQRDDDERMIVVVNYAAHQSQCYLKLPAMDLKAKSWQLADQLGGEAYERDGDSLDSQGLYLDMPPWQAAVYSIVSV
jgi:glycosidase